MLSYSNIVVVSPMESCTMNMRSNTRGFTLIEVVLAIALLIAIALAILAAASGGPPANTTTITPGPGTILPSGFRHSWTTVATDNDIEVGKTETYVYTYLQHIAVSGTDVPVENAHVAFAVVPGNLKIVSINGVAVGSQGGSGHTAATGASPLPGATSAPVAGTITIVITATSDQPSEGIIIATPLSHLSAPIHHKLEIYAQP